MKGTQFAVRFSILISSLLQTLEWLKINEIKKSKSSVLRKFLISGVKTRGKGWGEGLRI